MAAETTQPILNVIQDTTTVFPELWLEVFVVGDDYEQQAFAKMFIKAKCTRAKSLEESDLVVFTGGPDVNPLFYDESPHPDTSFSIKRDNDDMKTYAKALDLGIPMFGVCRGAQFIHVMMGGKLWQDIDNHNQDHYIWDVKGQQQIHKVSSVHHQAVRPNDNNGMEVVAHSHKSSERWKNEKEVVKGFDNLNGPDIEAFFYRDICAFCVQGHPEYSGYTEYLAWTLKKLEQYMSENPDIELRSEEGTTKSFRRLKREIMDQREIVWNDHKTLQPEEVN